MGSVSQLKLWKNVRLGCMFFRCSNSPWSKVCFLIQKVDLEISYEKKMVLSNEVGPSCTDLLSFALDMSQLLDILRQRWWQQGTTGNTKKSGLEISEREIDLLRGGKDRLPTTMFQVRTVGFLRSVFVVYIMAHLRLALFPFEFSGILHVTH